MKNKILSEIEALERRAEELRDQIKISKSGETLFQAPRSMWSEDDVVVEADGKGGAILMIVQGNYPADYTTHREQVFETEDEACEAAERLVSSHPQLPA